MAGRRRCADPDSSRGTSAAIAKFPGPRSNTCWPRCARTRAACGSNNCCSWSCGRRSSCCWCWPWPSRYLEQLGLPLVAGQRTLKVLVIDGSFSMGYKPTDKSRFERAKQLAAQIVDDSPQGDAFTLVLMGDPAQRDRRHASRRAGRFSGRDRKPQAAARRRRPARHADPGRTHLPGSRQAAGLTRAEVYFLTDLGRNTWVPDVKDAAASRISPAARAGWPSRPRWSCSTWDNRRSENLAVTSLAAQRAVCHHRPRGRALGPGAQFRRAGPRPSTGRAARRRPPRQGKLSSTCRPASRRRSRSRIASTRRAITSSKCVSSPICSTSTITAGSRCRSRNTSRVLCVNGKPGSGPMTGATDYLALALDPDAGDAGRGRPHPARSDRRKRAVGARPDASTTASSYATWPSSPPARPGLLEGVLNRGGGLVFFLGDQVLAERYNRELAGEQGVRMLPAQAGRRRPRGPIPLSLRSARLPPPAVSRVPGPRTVGAADHAGLQRTFGWRSIRIRKPAWRWRSTAAIRRSSKKRSARAARSWWPPNARCRRSIRRPRTPGPRCPPGPASCRWCRSSSPLAVGGEMSGAQRRRWASCWASRCAAMATRADGHRHRPSRRPRRSADGRSTREPAAGRMPTRRQSGVYQVELGARSSREEAFAVNVDTRRKRPDEARHPTSCREQFATHRQTIWTTPIRPRCNSEAGCTSACCTACWGCCLRNLSWPGGLDARHDERNLPAWLERWLGVDAASPGEGTVWSLENTWSWAPWVTLLFVLFAVGWVVFFYAREGTATGRAHARAAGGHAVGADGDRGVHDRRVHALAAPHGAAHRGRPGRRLGQHGHPRSLRRRKAAIARRPAHRGGRARAGRSTQPGQDACCSTRARTCWTPSQRNYRLKLYFVSSAARAQEGTLDELRKAVADLAAAAARARGWEPACAACSAICAARRRRRSSC